LLTILIVLVFYEKTKVLSQDKYDVSASTLGGYDYNAPPHFSSIDPKQSKYAELGDWGPGFELSDQEEMGEYEIEYPIELPGLGRARFETDTTPSWGPIWVLTHLWIPVAWQSHEPISPPAIDKITKDFLAKNKPPTPPSGYRLDPRYWTFTIRGQVSPFRLTVLILGAFVLVAIGIQGSISIYASILGKLRSKKSRRFTMARPNGQEMITDSPESSPKSHARILRLRWAVILILCTAVLGSLVTALFLRNSNQDSSQLQNAIPEKVIPEQTLELKDSAGNDVASIDAGGGGYTVIGIGGSIAFSVSAYENNHAVIDIPQSYTTIQADEAAERAASTAEAAKPWEEQKRDSFEKGKAKKLRQLQPQNWPRSWSDLRDFDISINGGFDPLTITTFWNDHDTEFIGKDMTDLNSTKSVVRLLIELMISKFSKPRIRSIAEIMPTEHLRLVDRKGWRLASLGLTSSGDPAIVFTDKNGGVRVAWVQRHGVTPAEPDWWDIALYDSDKLRASVEVRPGKPPDVAILDNIGTQYGLDFSDGKLALKQDGRSQFPQLWGLNFEPRRPIALYDSGGIQIWKAPVVLGQPVAAPTILPSKIKVLDDTFIRPSERRIIASSKGDMRPFYRVVGRMQNNSAVEIGEVHLRISILDQRSKIEADGADISLSIPIPPGATRAFDQEIQVLPPLNWTWTCEVISATPKQ
jgi:hypothetical protein